MRLAAPDRRKRLQIAALELFSQKGYRGTTTQAVARHAGVSEALLFRHFSSKQELYWSVLEEQCSARGGRARLDAILGAGDDDQEMFAAIAEDLLSRNFADPRLYRLLLFSGLESHQLSDRFFRTYISDYYETVAAHIRGRIAAGRFRQVDPLLSARLFIGMTLHYFLVQDVFRGSQQRDFDLKVVCRTVAEIWLGGVTMNVSTIAATATPAHVTAKIPSKSEAAAAIPSKAFIRKDPAESRTTK
ncbi:MAG TPA: TetR/AcrR family transcriptional regulator [Terriglobales bacterium]|nr:TetR/AcrR family transcriptional regulator [Terriglobales bacterium]